MSPWIQDDCPQCKRTLSWDHEFFREEDGDSIELLVECKACKAEVSVRYSCEEVELVEA